LSAKVVTSSLSASRKSDPSIEFYPHLKSFAREKVFHVVGVPYDEALASLDEVTHSGERLASIPTIQLRVLDFFPTFRRRDIERPSPEEMFKVKRVLKDVGLKAVVIQTSTGHLGQFNAHTSNR